MEKEITREHELIINRKNPLERFSKLAKPLLRNGRKVLRQGRENSNLAYWAILMGVGSSAEAGSVWFEGNHLGSVGIGFFSAFMTLSGLWRISRDQFDLKEENRMLRDKLRKQNPSKK